MTEQEIIDVMSVIISCKNLSGLTAFVCIEVLRVQWCVILLIVEVVICHFIINKY